MSLAKETAEKMLRLLEEAWQQGHDEAIAALRSEPVVEWEVAMRNLVFAARTTGGTAGPDEHLKLCCDDCEEVLAAAPSRESRTDRQEPSGFRYTATVVWDDKTTVHEGVYPSRQEWVAQYPPNYLTGYNAGIEEAAKVTDHWMLPEMSERIRALKGNNNFKDRWSDEARRRS